MSRRGRVRSQALSGIALMAILVPASLVAQERLVRTRTVAAGATFERVSFGSDGVGQLGFAGVDSARIGSARQLTLPISASGPLGGGWRLDVTALYGSARVGYRRAGAAGAERSATLSGISDLRLRATGRLFKDNVVLTMGLNAPSGQTSLGEAEFSALRIVAAPALGLSSAPVGAGLSGTVGLVVAHQLGAWAVAYGSSVERRGEYQPVAALTAGTGTADYRPGGVFRASISGDRLLGDNRLSVAGSLDLFADDRFRAGVLRDSGAVNPPPQGADVRVRLGPVLSADAQLAIAAPRVRELLTFASYRWRAPFARDGKTVEQSSGTYLEVGVRVVAPFSPKVDVILASDARWHSGLGIDQGLPTSGVTSGSMTAGLQFGRGAVVVQPYLRAQAGVLRQRSVAEASASRAFLGAAGGLVVVTRF